MLESECDIRLVAANGRVCAGKYGPLFADADHVDFHLIATSPARGAGLDLAPYFPAALFPNYDFRKDIDGKTRTVWDVGAYAY